MSFGNPDISRASGTQLGPTPQAGTPPTHTPNDYRLSVDQLPLSVVSRDWDYLIYSDGANVNALNGKTGAIDYSTAVAQDHAPVFQSVANALNAAAGGVIACRGQFTTATTITLYPGVGLIGQGPLSDKPSAGPVRAATITYSGNGSAIVLTSTAVGGSGGNQAYKSFPYLANLQVFGSGAGASQNGVEFNDSGAGGGLFDAYCFQVIVMGMGQHGFYHNTAGKVWIHDCYSENNTGDGIRVATANGTLSARGNYIFGNTGNGVGVTAASTNIYLTNNRIWSNTNTGYLNTVSVNELLISGNSFKDNGSGSSANPQCNPQQMAGSGSLNITGNIFRDDRGGSACLYHIRLSNGSTIANGTVTGNSFTGAQTAAILVTYRTANRLVISDNAGYNDVTGKIASPFNTDHIGVEGNTAAPAASTAYRVVGAPLNCNFAGGTGVSITITDSGGNTVVAGLSTFTGILPVGYSINFGAFSVAPATVYVGVA